jgi:hypothetical protein
MAYPPELVEDAVGWLLPPACREEVLGDLCEQYATAAQYAVNSLTVAPRVILSQIRRNTDARVFLPTICAICYSFAAGSADFPRNDFPLHSDPLALLRLAIPSVAALLVLLLRNGYADPEERRRRAITLDIAAAMGVAGVTQLALMAAFRSDLMLLRWCPSEGTVIGWLFVILLRAIFPPDMRLPAPIRSSE